MKQYDKYKIIPQAKIYDSMNASWKPFVMFSQFSNIRSKYCNTDIYGLRFNELKNKQKKISIFDQKFKSKKEKGVIVGNSMSFGEGLTSDIKTISNYLTRNTKYQFYNLSGRGFSGFQEIINFLMHCNKINNLKRVIVISGLNDSYLPYYIKKFDKELNPIFGFERFKNGMLRNSLGWKNKIFSFFFKNFFSEKEDLYKINILNWKEIFIKNFLEKKQIKNNFSQNKDKILKLIIERNIFIWKLITKGMDIKLDFILQPVSNWCKKYKTDNEKIILELEEKDPKLKNILKYVDLKKYKLIKKIIIPYVKKNNINFYDLNEFFNRREFKEKSLFSGKFHVSDEGSRLISKYIIEKILS